jgi:hypothetical protein
VDKDTPVALVFSLALKLICNASTTLDKDTLVAIGTDGISWRVRKIAGVKGLKRVISLPELHAESPLLYRLQLNLDIRYLHIKTFLR